MDLFFLFLSIPIFLMLAGVIRKAREVREVEEKREDDRKAKLKALYPDSPTYEERMDAQYGPTGPQDTSEE